MPQWLPRFGEDRADQRLVLVSGEAILRMDLSQFSESHGDRGLPAAASVVLVGCNAPVAAAFWGGAR